MSKEELLKERYKVIADYPGNKFTVGDILTYVREVAQTYDMWRNQNGVEIIYSSFHKYPHLFKKLEWWEERKPEEMPEYLQCQSADFVFKKGDIVKVDKWLESFGPTLRFYSSHTDKITLHPHLYTPATLTEYEQYINQQPQTNEQ